MDDLISRQALYNRAATLEAQALDYVEKLIERDGDEPSTEWKVWSAILTERTAFKHDVFDAPSIQPDLIAKIQNGIEVTDADDEYSCGMRNGMRWCMSLIDGKEPLYENCPSAQLEREHTMEEFMFGQDMGSPEDGSL